MSTSETGASSVIWTLDIINSPEKRFKEVKKEKRRRIDEWKRSLTKLTKNAEELLEEYNNQKDILKTKIRFGEDVEQNQKKLDKLEERIKKLQKDKYTDSDLAEQKARIAQEIMDECEGSVCPFCGKIFGSDGEVKSHLNMTDEEMEKMNKVALRDPNYRQKYIKEKGINEFDMDVKLDDGEIAKVKVGEQIHHIVSVDPYSSTLRVSRLGNLAGFDINELPNLTALPYAKNISDFPENFQSVIQESIVKK
jgi:DNA repair exonuclease SbcCD ATPase subunit